MIFISSSARPRFGRRTFLSERRSAECTCAHFNGDIRPKLPASLSSMTPEEDLEYLVNGKSTPGVKMTYDQMEAVFAPLLKIRLRPASFPPRSKHLTTRCRKNFRRCAYGPRGDSRRERTCRTRGSRRSRGARNSSRCASCVSRNCTRSTICHSSFLPAERRRPICCGNARRSSWVCERGQTGDCHRERSRDLSLSAGSGQQSDPRHRRRGVTSPLSLTVSHDRRRQGCHQNKLSEQGHNEERHHRHHQEDFRNSGCSPKGSRLEEGLQLRKIVRGDPGLGCSVENVVIGQNATSLRTLSQRQTVRQSELRVPSTDRHPGLEVCGLHKSP
jgi:hypothetical protein